MKNLFLITICLILCICNITLPVAAAVPNAPTITDLTRNGTGFTLKWNSVKGAKDYEIYRKIDSGNWKKRATTTKTTYKQTGVNYNATYSFKVRSVNKNGKSEFSDVKSIKTSSILKPNTISTEIANYKSIRIKWSRSYPATGYEIYYSTSKSGTFKKLTTLTGGSKTSYVHKGVEYKKTYYYKVRTIYKNKKSSFTKVVSNKAELLYGDKIKINSSNFPDPNLRKFLKQREDDDMDGYINLSESTYVYLDYFGDYNIKNMKGLEYFQINGDLCLAYIEDAKLPSRKIYPFRDSYHLNLYSTKSKYSNLSLNEFEKKFAYKNITTPFKNFYKTNLDDLKKFKDITVAGIYPSAIPLKDLNKYWDEKSIISVAGGKLKNGYLYPDYDYSEMKINYKTKGGKIIIIHIPSNKISELNVRRTIYTKSNEIELDTTMEIISADVYRSKTKNGTYTKVCEAANIERSKKNTYYFTKVTYDNFYFPTILFSDIYYDNYEYYYKIKITIKMGESYITDYYVPDLYF